MNNESKIKELVLESFEKTIVWGNNRTELILYDHTKKTQKSLASVMNLS